MDASVEFAGAEWYRDLDLLPNSVEKILLTFYNYCGYLGNSIFFVCSAWFLLEKKRNKKIKILKLETDVWIISVIWLAVFVLCKVHMRGSIVLRCLFPTTFNNNWFVTAYMLFYFIHPALNLILDKVSRTQLKYGCLFFVLLICIWVPFFQQWSDFMFYFSYPLMWVLVYFCIAYLKKYHGDLIKNRKFSVALLCVGLVGLIAEITVTYYFGEVSFVIGGSGMRWNMWWNPLHWFIAFGSFNLFRTFRFHSRFINRVSSLSLLVYLIHENFLVREHLRPYIYVYIERFHSEQVALWLFIFAALTFAVSTGAAFVYQITIQRATYHIADIAYGKIKRVLLREHF